jgi:hypothetical protein
MTVRKKHADALRSAMEQLLTGDKGTTNGQLTWTNVHLRADVAKATANRAHDVKAEWKAKLEELARTAAESKAAEKIEAPASEHSVASGLRATIRIMADHIQALTITVDDLTERLRHSEAATAELSRRLTRANGGNVISYPGKS